MKKFLGILCLLSLMFIFVACKDDKDQKKVDEVHGWLTLPGLTNDLTNSSERIVMPTEKDGVTISWEIDKPEYIATNGVITQPSNEVGNQVVTLTATLTLNKATKTKEFKGTVLALPALEDTEPLLDEDFKSYQNGDFKDQVSDWAVVSNKAGDSIYTVIDKIEGNTIPGGSKALKVEAKLERTLETSIQHNYDVVVIEADLMQTASSDASPINIQSSSSEPAVAFGLNGKTLYYRVDNGEQPGIEVELNKWYRARFEVDLKNKTIELFYYEEGQLIPVTPEKIPFTRTTDLQNFFIRTGSSTTPALRNPAYITNIVVNRPEALPRPVEKVKLGNVTGISDVNIEKGSIFTVAVPKVFNYYGSASELVKDTDYTLVVTNPVDIEVAGEYEVVYTFTNKTDSTDLKAVKQKVTVYEPGEPNVITNVVSTTAEYPDWLSTFTISVVQPTGDLYYLLSKNETETAEAIKAGTKIEITTNTVSLDDLFIDDNTYLHLIIIHNGDSQIESHEINRNTVTEIATPQEFYNATQTSQSEQEKTYFLLTADLDFTDFVWGNVGNKFYGILDGNGFKISNLTITAPSKTYGGIFRELDGAIIKNLEFENVNVISADQRAGVISGRTSGSKVTVENITIINSKVTVGDSSTTGSDMHGALLIGRINVETDISNIKVVSSEVLVNGKYVGGLVSYVEAKVVMSDIDVEIKVTENSSNSQLVGGIVGRVGTSGNLTLNRVIAKVDLTGAKNLGGLIGKNEGTATVTDALITGLLNVTGEGSSGAICGNASTVIEFTNVWAVALTGEDEKSSQLSAPEDNTLTSLDLVSTSTWWTENMPNIADSELWDTAGFAELIREEVVKHTITFVLEDVVVDPIEVRDSSKAILPVPVKDGFNFIGWFTDEGFTTPFDPDTLITEDHTLYGQFEEITDPLYTVTFDSNEGSAVEPQTVVEGELALEPADPTKDGFAFGGWYLDAGFETEHLFTEAVMGDITLYAKWIPLFTVTFETNGGTVLVDGVAVISLDVQEGQVLPALTFNKKFNTYVGLFTNEGLTEEFNLETVITADITLYVDWLEDEPNYINSVEEFVAFLDSPQEAKYLLTVDIDMTDHTYTAKTFSGLLDGQGHTISNLSYTGGDRSGLFDYLRGEVRNLVFENSSITSSGRAGLIAGEIDVVGVVIENIVVEGLTVSGNNKNGVGGLVAYVTNGTGGVTFSKIRMNNVNVTNVIEMAGGVLGYSRGAGATIINDIHLTNITVKASNRAAGVVGYVNAPAAFILNRAFLENISAEGADYIGGIVGRVSDGYSNGAVSDVLMKDITILTATKYYNVVSGRYELLSLTNVFGGIFSLPGTPSDGQTVLVDTTDLTLDQTWYEEKLPSLTTGVWSIEEGLPVLTVFSDEVVKHTITFVVEDVVVDPIEVRDNRKAVLPVPEKDGFNFVGWFTDEGFLTPFDPDTLIIEDLTLYGQFEEISAPLYTVTFDSNEGSAVEYQTVVEGELAIEPTDPTKEGFAFGGWYLDAGFETEYLFAEPVMEDITLYAKWIPLFTVTFETNGGTVSVDGVAVTSLDVQEGTVLPELTFNKKFNTFVGLFTDEELTGQFDLETAITENITLYVDWIEDEPNYINSVEEFVAFLGSPQEAKYLLTVDIDMTGQTYTANNFAGLLDGQGHKISNLTYSGGDRSGLFTYLRGEVRNLIFENASITSTGRAGLIAGEIDALGVVIENIVVDGLTVNGKNKNGVGGLIGYIKDNSGSATFSKISMSNVNVTNDQEVIAGGIVGYFRGIGTTEFKDIHLDGVTVKATERSGGIVGYANPNTPASPANLVFSRIVLQNITVDAGNYAGGLIARNALAGTVSDVFMKDITVLNATGNFNVLNGGSTSLTLASVYGEGFTLPSATTKGQSVLVDTIDLTLDQAWYEENLLSLTTEVWSIVDGLPVLTVFSIE